MNSGVFIAGTEGAGGEVEANGVSVDFWSSKTGTGATGPDATAGAAHTHTITQDGTARIAAAVVIMVYLDL